MSEIKHILLIPAEGDPHNLLKEGPCGARPPMARKFGLPRLMHTSNEFADPTYNGEKCVACGQPWPCDTPGEVEQVADEKWVPAPLRWWLTGLSALVLAWSGEPVAEGLDRLGRAEGVTREWVSKVVGFALGWWPDDVDALTDPDLPGTLVFLDAEGREVSDE